MYPYQHFISCVLLSAVLWPFYGVSSLLVFVGGFFIDVDHNLLYIYKFKDWDFFHAYNYYNDASEKKIKGMERCLLIFHTVEFFVFMLVLGFFFDFAVIVFYGVVLHLFTDGIHMAQHNLFNRRVFSLIYEYARK